MSRPVDAPAEEVDRASLLGSLLVWLVWLLLVIAWTPIVLLVFLGTAWWDRSRRITGLVFQRGSRALMTVNPYWEIAVRGRVPRREEHPFVVVCNHESLADVILAGTVPWEMKWLSKHSNFRVPFLGVMMWLAGFVGVRRHDAESRREAYVRLRRWIERGSSVIIFPEGTRSRTSELLPFRNGAFRLAIETGRPVLPLALSGTRMALRKGSLRFGRARATLQILPPVPTAGLGLDDVEELRERIRTQIDQARKLRAATSPRPAASE